MYPLLAGALQKGSIVELFALPRRFIVGKVRLKERTLKMFRVQMSWMCLLSRFSARVLGKMMRAFGLMAKKDILDPSTSSSHLKKFSLLK